MSDPTASWQRLRTGNERFFTPLRSGRSTMQTGATPTAAVFGCADGGVCTEMVFGQSWGSLINVSTWGHVIDTGVLATMEYAVGTLEVPLIVVLGHYDCAAIRTALRAWDDALFPEGAVRAVVEQVSSSIIRRGSATVAAHDAAAAHTVETGLSLLHRSRVIAQRVDLGLCGIVCAMPDLADGHVRACATIGKVDAREDDLLECV